MAEKYWPEGAQREEKCYQRNLFSRGEFRTLFESLKNSREFSFVYHYGRSYANRYLVMYVVENSLGKNRLGISVSKKVGNSVVRHRLTRLIRENIRLREEMFSNGSGMDIVVIARVAAKGKDYWKIGDALLHLARLHKILKAEQ